MQGDEGANPGMLWVEQGARLWHKPEGAAGKAAQLGGEAQEPLDRHVGIGGGVLRQVADARRDRQPLVLPIEPRLGRLVALRKHRAGEFRLRRGQMAERRVDRHPIEWIAQHQRRRAGAID